MGSLKGHTNYIAYSQTIEVYLSDDKDTVNEHFCEINIEQVNT